jgi:hypothetical protein
MQPPSTRTPDELRSARTTASLPEKAAMWSGVSSDSEACAVKKLIPVERFALCAYCLGVYG